ncbi:CLUMA_CG012252, isoform A [Clunio marinus]|uniref:CLUMA_CG012252, isoform A n=1 Tax=Clunio marinus TaxID=568069 RepID=A0A1J1IF94_9DIPT|nr:CLUMA_CG012252, isoform A [Clunio marinus]
MSFNVNLNKNCVNTHPDLSNSASGFKLILNCYLKISSYLNAYFHFTFMVPCRKESYLKSKQKKMKLGNETRLTYADEIFTVYENIKRRILLDDFQASWSGLELVRVAVLFSGLMFYAEEQAGKRSVLNRTGNIDKTFIWDSSNNDIKSSLTPKFQDRITYVVWVERGSLNFIRLNQLSPSETNTLRVQFCLRNALLENKLNSNSKSSVNASDSLNSIVEEKGTKVHLPKDFLGFY